MPFIVFFSVFFFIFFFSWKHRLQDFRFFSVFFFMETQTARLSFVFRFFMETQTARLSSFFSIFFSFFFHGNTDCKTFVFYFTIFFFFSNASFTVFFLQFLAEPSRAENITTYTGLVLSLIFLSIAFVAFCVLGKEATNSNSIHQNITACLFIAQLLFLIALKTRRSLVTLEVYL